MSASLAVDATMDAQTLVRDTTHPSMAGVKDVTGGLKYLLRDDDLVMLQTEASGSSFDTSVVNLATTNSKISGSTTTSIVTSTSGDSFDPNTGVTSSEAVGRMYNIKSDTIAVLTAIDNAGGISLNPDSWVLNLFDPLTGYQGVTTLQSRFQPHGTVYTRVVMGNFRGDNLVEPLLFYCNIQANDGDAQWGLKVIAAQNTSMEGPPLEGPEYQSNAQPVPIPGDIVVGDFNGDGRDEIAALMNDYQTVVFFSVDPTTLALTPISTPVKLPVQMKTGQVALTSGRFRNLNTNFDLVVFGQIQDDSKPGYSVIPIQVTADTNEDGSFTTQVVQQAAGAVGSVSEPFYRFPDYHGETGAIAQAAPLISWPAQTEEQLVLGIQTQNGASYIMIGDFQPYNDLTAFRWYSKTEREYDGGSDYLINLSVGNFDRLNPDGTYNAGFQIQSQENILTGGVVIVPHSLIFNINLPTPAPPAPDSNVTDWLKQVDDYTLNNGIFDSSASQLAVRPDTLVAGDTQGRSLRLGSPTIVRIKSQTQPDLILAVPPMHVDYIATNTIYNSSNPVFPGCEDPDTPCIANVSVKPSVPPSQGTSFSTEFKFMSTSSSSAARKSTTSWGISDKVSVGESFTFNDGLENASGSIKDTTKIAHDQNVSKAWNTYNSQTTSLTETTGFADHIFYTQRGVNVYYYPVLGCDTNGTNCTNTGSPTPAWVEFSVPDHVVQADLDGTLQDWYQPVHEPGNLLSYPWSEGHLSDRFTDGVTLLTTSNCTGIGSNSGASSTSWSNNSSTNQSSGSTNAFSNELSMSYSAGIGAKDVDNANINISDDVAASNSLSTLNQSTLSLSSASGISQTIPAFMTDQCCSYGFKQYIFGLPGKEASAAGAPCTKGQNPATDQCVALNDPDGSPLTIASTGPLFTGYAAALINTGTGDVSGCASDGNFWRSAYPLPDVALNHPERWNWNKGTQQVTFNPADTTGILSPLLQQFYAMKGFFITKKGDSAEGSPDTTLPSSPNLEEAASDDQLILTTRVYNYSLVPTPSTAQIHVRFYGQLYSPKNGDLSGNGFQIGQDQIIPSIGGFQAADDAPNWKLSSVEFDPSAYPSTKSGSVYMLFWVVVWMQNANGGMVPEMVSHGLTGLPDPAITQIIQEPIEPYSNNVGLYGVHQQFHIIPAGIPPSATGATGSVSSIALSANPNLQLESRTVISSTVQSAGAGVDSVNLAYYDGDPSKNGVLLDEQKILHMDPGTGYKHNSYFTPSTCGTHTLYAQAWLASDPVVQAMATTTVTVNQATLIQALITSTQTAGYQDSQLLNNLVTLLQSAQQAYQQGQSNTASILLSRYMQELSIPDTGAASNTAQLLGQAGVSMGCAANGFVLSSLANAAIVSAGQSTTYALAVTPSGGFKGAVGLMCSGAPKGATCLISSQTVTLDGTDQIQVKVAVSTNGTVAVAGVLPSPDGPFRLTWLLMTLAGLITMGLLRRGRIRFTALACVLCFVICWSATGCGKGSVSTGITPTGIYTLTLQGTSGNTVNKTQVTLIVE